MKKIKGLYLKIILLALDIIIITLSALPNSSVLKFVSINEGNDPVASLRYYSCFDLINLGYANFGPFLSAYLSIILIGLIIISFFVKNKSFKSVITILVIIGLISSLFPFILTSFTIFTPVIALIWLIIALIQFFYDRLSID